MQKAPCPSATCARPALAAATLLACATLTVMAGATVTPALPALKEHFGSDPRIDLWVRLVLALPALAIALSAPPAGWFCDRWGRVPVLRASLLLYAAAGSSGLWVDSLEALLAGRFLLGMGVGGIMTSSTALIADGWDGARRARILGLQGTFMGVGGVVFLTLGGLLADLGWRWPFGIYLASLLLVPGTLVALSDPHRPTAAQAAATAADEARPPWPVLARIYVLAFLGMAVFYLIPTQIPFLLQELSGSHAAAAGLAIAAGSAVSATVSSQYGRVARHLGFPAIAATALGLLALAYLVVGLSSTTAGVVAGLAVAGLGTGLLMPNGNVWVTTTVAPSLRGRALGALNTSVFAGQFLSPLAVQFFLADGGPAHAFLVVGGIAAAAGVSVAVQAGFTDGRLRRA